jgi:hypothetical protein
MNRLLNLESRLRVIRDRVEPAASPVRSYEPYRRHIATESRQPDPFDAAACTDAIAAMELSFCEGAPHPRWLPSFSSCPIPALRPT